MKEKEFVYNNKVWVDRYDNTVEVEKIKYLLDCIGMSKRNELRIVDVGCGSGRSVDLLRNAISIPSEIIAIDKREESVLLASQYHNSDQCVCFECVDAYEFFSRINYDDYFDIILFAWSFFDMNNDFDMSRKKITLYELLSMVKRCLREKGCIIVLQPTKGGTFEKFLSRFMPSSDDDYQLVHEFLIQNGFHGANNPFPEKNDLWAIWSFFRYNNEEELFEGVSSIIYLEQNKTITRKEFCDKFVEIKRELDIKDGELSDCVNIYYLCKED